jgi:hypothetical protein
MAVVLLLSLAVVLVVFGLGLAWQERRVRRDDPIVYGVEECLEYVWDRLDPDVARDATRSDVRRILEWELHYLQQPKVRGESEAVVGGLEAAQYAQDRATAAGHPYEPPLILSVLELQAEYLVAIGAVAEPADEPVIGEPS